jgi:hypothetical protein
MIGHDGDDQRTVLPSEKDVAVNAIESKVGDDSDKETAKKVSVPTAPHVLTIEDVAFARQAFQLPYKKPLPSKRFKLFKRNAKVHTT